MHNLSPAEAAQEMLNRRQARSRFEAWCRLCGYIPAKHHLLVIDELQQAVDNYKQGIPTFLMILMPPGSAKSTYTSKLFPPWFLAQLENLAILACSHSAELATDFGRAGRNLVDTYSQILGFTLAKDRSSADAWEISNGGYYRAAGCGAGIAGRRADLGLIDDFCGTEEEASSKTFNDKIWNWWQNDFIPRLKPGAIRILIANHRNEDDLCGRLMAAEGQRWKIIRLRLMIETTEQAEQDPLKRSVGDYLWPEYFTKELVLERMRNPRASGIEQQEPSPMKGGFFQSEWLDNNTYKSLNDLKGGHIYGASDHAVSERQTADPSCMGLGVWKDGFLYIHPDLVWERIDTMRAVGEFIRFGRKYSILQWFAEKGHISKSLMPFLLERMQQEQVYYAIQQVTPVNDKMTRAQSIQGMMSMGLVKWPALSIAPWMARARREMLMFPNGKHDDFVDFIAHLGRGVHQFSDATKPQVSREQYVDRGFNITPRSLREQLSRSKKHLAFN